MKNIFKKVFPKRASLKNVLREERITAFTIACFFLFSFLLMFHTFGYDGKNHNILIASRLWSDFGSHIPLIRSFSLGDNFDLLLQGKPEFPIYPGEPIRYHFLFYALVGLLERLGMRLDWALNIPSSVGFFFLLFFVFSIAKKLFADTRVAILSVIFFLFNGSLAFLRFFELHPISKNTPKDIINASAFPAFGPWGPGDVSAFWNLNIYTNQRHLGAGFSIALGFILTVLHLEKKPFSRQLPWAIFWGVIVGMLPYFHTPALVIMALLLSIYFLLFSKLRKFLIVAGLVSILTVLPQLLHFPQGPKSMSWYPGYLIHDDLSVQRFILYWWKNLGIHAILIPIGFFLIPPRAKKTIVPIFVLFIGANLFKFSQEVAGSHKFFNFVLILGNMISAFVIMKLWNLVYSIKFHSLARLPARLVRLLSYSLICVYIFFLTLSGVIDFFVVFNDRKGAIADVGSSEVATWIAKNTPPSSVFLNSSFLYHPASIAGRKIYMGWPYFVWGNGYLNDRLPIMKRIYESKNPAIFCPLLQNANIAYITVEDTTNDLVMPHIDPIYFINNYQPLYSKKDTTYAIFSTDSLCGATPAN